MALTCCKGIHNMVVPCLVSWIHRAESYYYDLKQV